MGDNMNILNMMSAIFLKLALYVAIYVALFVGIAGQFDTNGSATQIKIASKIVTGNY